MKQKTQSLHAEQGLTLVEVLISIAILAVAIMSVFSIYTQCIVEIRRAKNRTLATRYAQMMMEMITSTPHDIPYYHGLTTAGVLPQHNPVRDDVLKWAQILQTFPTNAVGTISVVDDVYASLVTVAVRYGDYGREMTNTLMLKIPRKRIYP